MKVHTGALSGDTYPRGVPFALERATKVVDHYTCSAGGEENGICFTEPTPGSGNNDDLAVVTEAVRRCDVVHNGICGVLREIARGSKDEEWYTIVTRDDDERRRKDEDSTSKGYGQNYT